MGVNYSPKIVTDGLVLALDAANLKSFRGEPTVNLAANGGLVGMSGITLTFLDEIDGWKRYSISGTFTGGTYPYTMYVTPVNFTVGIQYTSRCIVKTNALSKFNYLFGYKNIPYRLESTGDLSYDFSVARWLYDKSPIKS
jgi:hypothetical protein